MRLLGRVGDGTAGSSGAPWGGAPTCSTCSFHSKYTAAPFSYQHLNHQCAEPLTHNKWFLQGGTVPEQALRLAGSGHRPQGGERTLPLD